MKRILVLILTTVFVFLLSSYILANTPNSDLIYSVMEDPAYLNASVYGTGTDFSNIFLGVLSYYENQETYANIEFDKSYIYLSGSYLSNSGLFLGASGYFDEYNKTLGIIPGYRYNFSKTNYIAGKVIWRNNFSFNNAALIDYNIFGKYFDEKTKIEGQFDYNKYDITLNGDINRKIAKGLVIGSNLSVYKVYDYNYYYCSSYYVIDLDGGLSFNNDFLASNLRLLLESPISTPIHISPALNADTILYIGSLGLGFNYFISTNFEQWYQSYLLKGKLRFSDSSLLFKFLPSNKSWSLSYENRL
jgi:hypothetical protein